MGSQSGEALIGEVEDGWTARTEADMNTPNAARPVECTKRRRVCPDIAVTSAAFITDHQPQGNAELD
jgi:hypothetical protein